MARKRQREWLERGRENGQKEVLRILGPKKAEENISRKRKRELLERGRENGQKEAERTEIERGRGNCY